MYLPAIYSYKSLCIPLDEILVSAPELMPCMNKYTYVTAYIKAIIILFNIIIILLKNNYALMI